MSTQLLVEYLDSLNVFLCFYLITSKYWYSTVLASTGASNDASGMVMLRLVRGGRPLFGSVLGSGLRAPTFLVRAASFTVPGSINLQHVSSAKHEKADPGWLDAGSIDGRVLADRWRDARGLSTFYPTLKNPDLNIGLYFRISRAMMSGEKHGKSRKTMI